MHSTILITIKQKKVGVTGLLFQLQLNLMIDACQNWYIRIQWNFALFQTKVSCRHTENSNKVIFTSDIQRTVTKASKKQNITRGHRATFFSRGISLLHLCHILYILLLYCSVIGNETSHNVSFCLRST